MANIDRGFHSLISVEEGIPKVSLALDLPPYVNKDKIGVNVRGLHTMMRLGGINHLQVVTTSGETSSYTPTVVGFSPDGSLYAGKSGTATIVPTYSVERSLNEDSPTPHFIAGRWADAKVEINMDEVQDKISRGGESLHSEKAWGAELDSAIKKGVTQAGIEHVIFDSSPRDVSGFGLASTLGITTGAGQQGWARDMVPIEGVIFENLLLHGGLNAILRLEYQIRGYDTGGFRWSVFSGPQIDRAVILQAMSKTRKLVKALPSEKI